MEWSHYRFHSVWRLDADPDAVYRLLERPDHYPDWWPQVREVRRTGETSGMLRFRSALPYDLNVAAHSTRHDPDRRILEVALTGDLEGWVRWTVLAATATAAASGAEHPGTRLVFEQEVVVRNPLMRRLAIPCRPLFLANHALMMRGGRTGLLARLAAEPHHVG